MIPTKQLDKFFDVIKHPIITDKATRLTENNQYSFAVDRSSNKYTIKAAIEYIFNVKVDCVNTMHLPVKKRKVKNITGKKPCYKKAIIKLNEEDTINLFNTEILKNNT
uniref:Large ribosomal subunit protein uL23c n=1 Tax=Hildenbrandia rivularis TaxID=135206 RepID=A0A1C9CFV2_9FLOR|nr:ribosomal protein L23 [Hildenbrandia rivularis]AOM67242.1 ribosomal protein L23 [Hildenbrandia rivularis]